MKSYAAVVRGDDESSIAASIQDTFPSKLPQKSLAWSRFDDIFHVKSIEPVGSSGVVFDPETKWNNWYFETLLMSELTTSDKLRKYSTLRAIHRDFVDAATRYAKTIISEFFVSKEYKTIDIAPMGGRGGIKFKTHGILFKLAAGTQDDDRDHFEDNDENAAKAMGHQMKGADSYFKCKIHDLHVALQVMIDYKGFRMHCQALLDIDNTTLCMGTPDATKTILNNDSELTKKMRFAAQELNIRKHMVKELKFYSACDVEGHKDRHSGRYYIIDLERVFPPEYPAILDNLSPRKRLYVDQKVFAAHPETGKMRNAKILTTHVPENEKDWANERTCDLLFVRDGRVAYNVPESKILLGHQCIFWRFLRPEFVKNRGRSMIQKYSAVIDVTTLKSAVMKFLSNSVSVHSSRLSTSSSFHLGGGSRDHRPIDLDIRQRAQSAPPTSCHAPPESSDCPENNLPPYHIDDEYTAAADLEESCDFQAATSLRSPKPVKAMMAGVHPRSNLMPTTLSDAESSAGYQAATDFEDGSVFSDCSHSSSVDPSPSVCSAPDLSEGLLERVPRINKFALSISVPPYADYSPRRTDTGRSSLNVIHEHGPVVASRDVNAASVEFNMTRGTSSPDIASETLCPYQYYEPMYEQQLMNDLSVSAETVGQSPLYQPSPRTTRKGKQPGDPFPRCSTSAESARPVALSSDGLSRFSEDDSEAKERNKEIFDATNDLLFKLIPCLVEDLLKNPLVYSMTDYLHVNGVNLRHSGFFRFVYLERVSDQFALDGNCGSFHDTQKVLLKECICRTLKGILRELQRSWMSSQMTASEQGLHQLIVDFLNTVTGAHPRSQIFWDTHVTNELIKRFGEVALRAIPQNLGLCLKRFIDSDFDEGRYCAWTGSDKSCPPGRLRLWALREADPFFLYSIVFGLCEMMGIRLSSKCTEQLKLFQTKLETHKMFSSQSCVTLPVSPAVSSSRSKDSTPPSRSQKSRLAPATGLLIRSSSSEEFSHLKRSTPTSSGKNPMISNGSHPVFEFVIADIEEIIPVIKHMHQLDYVEGVMMSLEASELQSRLEDQSAALRLVNMSVERLNRAKRTVPDDFDTVHALAEVHRVESKAYQIQKSREEQSLRRMAEYSSGKQFPKYLELMESMRLSISQHSNLKNEAAEKSVAYSSDLPHTRCSKLSVSYRDDIMGLILTDVKHSKSFSQDKSRSKNKHHSRDMPQLLVTDLTVWHNCISLTYYLSQLKDQTKDSHSNRFFPLIINDEHASRALPLIKEELVRLDRLKAEYYKSPVSLSRQSAVRSSCVLETLVECRYNLPKYDPTIGFRVLSSIMASLTRNLFRKPKDPSEVVNAESERKRVDDCITSHLRIHHMMLFLAESDKKWTKNAMTNVSLFRDNPKSRAFRHVPNLAAFLANILFCRGEFRWIHIAEAYLQEFFIRQVVEFLKERDSGSPCGCLGHDSEITCFHPELIHIHDEEVDLYRLFTTFNATILSCRQLMFQVSFLKMMSGPDSMDLESYNASLGSPTTNIRTTLHEAYDDIMAVQDYEGFLLRIDLMYTPAEITKLLHHAIWTKKGELSEQMHASVISSMQRAKVLGAGQENASDETASPSAAVVVISSNENESPRADKMADARKRSIAEMWEQTRDKFRISLSGGFKIFQQSRANGLLVGVVEDSSLMAPDDEDCDLLQESLGCGDQIAERNFQLFPPKPTYRKGSAQSFISRSENCSLAASDPDDNSSVNCDDSGFNSDVEPSKPEPRMRTMSWNSCPETQVEAAAEAFECTEIATRRVSTRRRSSSMGDMNLSLQCPPDSLSSYDSSSPVTPGVPKQHLPFQSDSDQHVKVKEILRSLKSYASVVRGSTFSPGKVVGTKASSAPATPMMTALPNPKREKKSSRGGKQNIDKGGKGRRNAGGNGGPDKEGVRRRGSGKRRFE